MPAVLYLLFAWPARLRRTTRKRTRNYKAHGHAPHGNAITVLSQKGGTGKTTTARTLADAFRRVGLEQALEVIELAKESLQPGARLAGRGC
jgi:Mrp family chromosome partitioning ATPase